MIADQARYASVLAAMVLGVDAVRRPDQALQRRPSLDRLGARRRLARAAPLFFVWAPRLLLHHRVSARDLLPGAVFTLAGLVGLRLISSLLFTHWLNWYSSTYGAFGIIIALFFWIILEGTLLVLAAALSPALAERRDLRAGRA